MVSRFVHLHRNGPDSAVSMSKHTAFRLLLLFLEAMGALDFRVIRKKTNRRHMTR